MSNDTLGKLIAELRGLMAKAPIDPWWLEADGGIVTDHRRICYFEDERPNEEDAQLIVAMRNALPALLDAIETGEFIPYSRRKMIEEIADLKEIVTQHEKTIKALELLLAEAQRERDELKAQVALALIENESFLDQLARKRAEIAQLEGKWIELNKKLAASERAVVVELPDKESFTILDISDALAKAKIGLRINTPGKLWGPV